VALRGAIALAGAVDLRLTVDLAGDGLFAHDRQEVFALMGGAPDRFPERYKAGNPGDLLPFQVPQMLIQGAEDDQIPPELPMHWATLARKTGDAVKVEILPGADHFDIVDPESRVWKAVQDSVRGFVFHQAR
jgi:pimeloyl-ACP methyl ester carboxylesterase